MPIMAAGSEAYGIHGRHWGVFRGIYDNTCIFSAAAYTLHLLGLDQAIEYIIQRRLAFSRPESQSRPFLC